MLMLYFIIHLITVNYNKHNNSSHDRINNIMFLLPGKIKSQPIIILWYFFNNKIHKKKLYIHTGPCTNPYKRVENIIWYYNVKKKCYTCLLLLFFIGGPSPNGHNYYYWTRLLCYYYYFLYCRQVGTLGLCVGRELPTDDPAIQIKKKTKFLEKNKCI